MYYCLRHPLPRNPRRQVKYTLISPSMTDPISSPSDYPPLAFFLLLITSTTSFHLPYRTGRSSISCTQLLTHPPLSPLLSSPQSHSRPFDSSPNRHLEPRPPNQPLVETNHQRGINNTNNKHHPRHSLCHQQSKLFQSLLENSKPQLFSINPGFASSCSEAPHVLHHQGCRTSS